MAANIGGMALLDWVNTLPYKKQHPIEKYSTPDNSAKIANIKNLSSSNPPILHSQYGALTIHKIHSAITIAEKVTILRFIALMVYRKKS